MNSRTIRSLPFVGALVMLALTAGCSTPGAGTPPEGKTSVAQPTPGSAASTDTEALAAADLQVAEDSVLSEFPNAELPDVERLRFVSLDEWPKIRSDCMSDQGFPSTTDPDGGVVTQVPGGQAEAHAIAGFICDATYPVDPLYTQSLSSMQLDRLYDYFTGELTACLKLEGFEIGAPPSKTTFKAEYDSEMSWSPYVELVNADIASLEQDCPQTPDDLY